MSYAMTHLAVAKEINDTIKISNDLPQYFVGAIAPDSVHFREVFHSDMKKKSHFIPGVKPWGTISSVEECDDWLTCVIPKIKTKENQSHSDFYWGCLIHILADIWNTRKNFIYYSDWCIRENMPKDAYFNEQIRINLMLYNTVPWRNDVWEYLSEARGDDVSDIIRANEVEKFRDFVLNDCNYGKIKPGYSKVFLTLDENNRFIKNTANEIIDLLGTLR